MSSKTEKPGASRSVRPRGAAVEQPREPDVSHRASEESWIGGQDFWKRFVDRAVLNVQGMPRRKGMMLSGGVSSTSNGILRDCRIQVSRHSAGRDEQSKMELWYSPGDHRVQCWYQSQRMKDVELTLQHHEVRAAVAGKLLTAEQFADQIVNWMLTQVGAK